MSDGPPRDWADAHAWDAYFTAEVLAGRSSRSDGPFLRFLPITRKMGGRVWFPGCGLDEGPPIYAMRGRHVVATDFSRVAVRVQRRLADYFLTHVPAGTTPGTFEVLEQDFTRERPNREFDIVVNVRAFHGLSADAMRAAARQFHAALRPGGTCVIDTINVQGGLRDAIEDSLIAAGFYVPYQESARWYREQLERTGIAHATPLGRPRIPRAGQYPAEQFDECAQRDQAVLDSLREEYEARRQNEAAAVQAMADDPTTITAQVVYSSG